MTATAILVMLSLLGSPVVSVMPSGSNTCEEALAAQDEVVQLLEAKVDELEAALRERRDQVRVLELLDKVQEERVAGVLRLLEEERVAADRDRRRAVWAERWKALQYGSLGLAAGILVERIAE